MRPLPSACRWLPSSTMLCGLTACYVLPDQGQLPRGPLSKKQQRVLQQKQAELAKQGAGKVALAPVDNRMLSKIPDTDSFNGLVGYKQPVHVELHRTDDVAV